MRTFDLGLHGFDDADIDRLLADTNDDVADLDEAPEPPTALSASAAWQA